MRLDGHGGPTLETDGGTAERVKAGQNRGRLLACDRRPELDAAVSGDEVAKLGEAGALALAGDGPAELHPDRDVPRQARDRAAQVVPAFDAVEAAEVADRDRRHGGLLLRSGLGSHGFLAQTEAIQRELVAGSAVGACRPERPVGEHDEPIHGGQHLSLHRRIAA